MTRAFRQALSGAADRLRGPALPHWPALAVVAAAQLATLGWMVWERTSLLASGREIVLDVTPVDPRSLFRGDYVILSYDISRFDAALLEGRSGTRDTVHVTLAKEGDTWRVKRASTAAPRETADGEVTLKARARGLPRGPARGGQQVMAAYGIESYFVPEGEGRALEQLVGDRRVKAVVAVGRDGTAALKGLMVDGKLVYREPLL